MEALPDNIFLHQIFLYLDYFYDLDLLELRRVNTRFRGLVKIYFTRLNPCTYEIEYLNKQRDLGNDIKASLENQVSDCLENINKETHAELIDYISQTNQNKVEGDVLKGLKIVYSLVGVQLRNIPKVKSRTEQRKRNVYAYLEHVSDYWQFKNKIISLDVFEIKGKLLKKLKGKSNSIPKEKIQSLICLNSCLEYINLLCELIKVRDIWKYISRNATCDRITNETISERLLVLNQRIFL